MSKKKKLHIIMECNEHGEITSENIIVKVDDIPVGCIQSLKLYVQSNKKPSMTITFPDFTTIKNPFLTNINRKLYPWPKHIADNVEVLKYFKNIKISFKNLFSKGKNLLREIGTDGVIDHIHL